MAKIDLKIDEATIIGNANLDDDDPVVMLMQSIEAEIHEHGWDQKPTFFLILAVTDLTGAITAPVGAVGALGAIEWLMPDTWYENPSEITPFFAEFLRTDPRAAEVLKERLPDEYFGVAMFSEGWHVPMPPQDNTEEWHTWNWARLNGQFHNHLDRQEQRIGQVYLLNGEELMIERTRGEFPVVLRPGQDGVQRLAGRLPEACRSIRIELLRIMEGV